MKVIILAGGSGSRLWPLSNDENPKQLLAIDDKFSLLQNTFLRAMDFADAADIVTVTNYKYRDCTFSQLAELSSECRVLAEPCARNTAPAIACALEVLARENGDDIVAVLPADHLIRRNHDFKQTIEKAAKLAEKDFIVTLGIKPLYPETGFGYIKTREPAADGLKVEKFVEKPELALAEKYVESGDYYWNGGIFVGKISVFLQEFADFAPDIKVLTEKCSFENDEFDAEIFAQMPKISIDYAIMEKSARIALVELLSDWSDLGSWQAIYDLKDKDENGNVIIGKAVLHNVKNSLIYSPERVAAAADVENVVLVNANGITMICDLTKTQNVKNLQ